MSSLRYCICLSVWPIPCLILCACACVHVCVYHFICLLYFFISLSCSLFVMSVSLTLSVPWSQLLSVYLSSLSCNCHRFHVLVLAFSVVFLTCGGFVVGCWVLFFGAFAKNKQVHNSLASLGIKPQISQSSEQQEWHNPALGNFHRLIRGV